MKISELLREDIDADDEDEVSVDNDGDEGLTPNILVQFKKALDVNGNYPITFRDGSKLKLPLADIKNFVSRYVTMKPMHREQMQDIAVESPARFQEVLDHFSAPKTVSSIHR